MLVIALQEGADMGNYQEQCKKTAETASLGRSSMNSAKSDPISLHIWAELELLIRLMV